MVQSKSKRTARAASLGGLSSHPALNRPAPLLEYRMGSSEPLRLPDEANDPSAATVLKSEYTISSDAAGHAVWAENFNLSAARSVWTVTAGSTGASAAVTAHPQLTSFTAEAAVARMIAMRVSVMYIGAEQESAGYLSYEEKVNVAEVHGSTVDALHTATEVQVPAKDGLVVYLDYTQAPRWEDPTVAAFMANTFPTGVFVASGLPFSKALFRVRIERFLEYLPRESSLSEGDTRHEPHDPGAMGAHGALSGPQTSVHKHGAMEAFKNVVKGAANAAYHMVQPMMPYLVPKAREYLVNAAKMGLPLLL